jgi:ABC-type phosphate/phosphonate transport system substrate-binding protein
VRADAPYRSLPDTFAGKVGWTVEHSHSGFNALRHHLLRYRTGGRATLYREVVGHLVTARRILDGVLDGTIDVGPLDAYWHMLIRHHRPELTQGVRVLESTDVAPMPAFVAAPALPAEDASRLRAAFVAARTRDWFAPIAAPLLLRGFAAVEGASFARTLAWDSEAKAAGYPVPA